MTDAQNRARDLANTPANDLTPTALADYAQELAERHPAVSVVILDEDAIRAAGMGAFAAVAQGSAAEARLIPLEYEGTASAAAPRLGFIGKAVTFDCGGLSLKPGPSQIEMKFDMSGGAAVIEAVAALAELAAPVRVLRRHRRDREPAQRDARSSPETSSARSTARRSRSTTPTPRGAWCWPTASPTRSGRDVTSSSTSPR